MRGSHAGSFEVGHQLRDAKAWRAAATDTRRSATISWSSAAGISGLAAAHFFRAAAGPRARILILDNHDDFGGHAKRNEFTHGGRMLMLNGGTLNIEGPGQYSPQSMGLLRTIGIDIDRFERETAADRGTYASGSACAAACGSTRSGSTSIAWSSAPRGAARRPAPGPTSSRRRRSPSRPRTTSRASRARDQPDYMPGLSSDDKKQKLMHMSYQDFLLNVAKVHPDAVVVLPDPQHRAVPDEHRRAAGLLRVEHELSRVPGHEPGADAAGRADRRAGRRARTGEPGAGQRGRPLDPFPRRQRDDRAAAGALAHPRRRARAHAGGRRDRRASTTRRLDRDGQRDAHPVEQHRRATCSTSATRPTAHEVSRHLRQGRHDLLGARPATACWRAGTR